MFKKINLIILVTILPALFLNSYVAAYGKNDFLVRKVTIDGDTFDYRVRIPNNFNPKRKYPVVLFLHGSSGRGNDNFTQIEDGLPIVMGMGERLSYPVFSSFIGVFPQCSDEKYWVGEMAEQANKALDQTVEEFHADADRLYLTGFSMGGYGTIYLAAKYPHKFAAIVPIGGDVKPEPLTIPIDFPPPIKSQIPADMLSLYEAADPYLAFAKAIGQTPVWIFHGGEDNQVSVTDGRKMADAFKATGGQLKYTEYDGDRHFIFYKAYTEPHFWEWLLAQKLRNRDKH